MKSIESKRHGLARILSKMGLASRTQAAQWIAQGIVQVNGRVIRDVEFPVRMDIDRVSINNQAAEQQARIVIMLNKPRGLITTRMDEQQRETIYSCLPAELPWLGPIGRLDKASEGLLLLSNDPEWAARITQPEYHCLKMYHVQVTGKISEQQLQLLQSSVQVENEVWQLYCVKIIRQGEKNTWLEITLDEGKNRQIRRVLQAVEITVLRLIRVAIGELELGELTKGQWRYLSAAEIHSFDNR